MLAVLRISAFLLAAAVARAQVVAPFAQTFDGLASALTTLVPGTGTTALGAAWAFDASNCMSRGRVVTISNLNPPPPPPPASPPPAPIVTVPPSGSGNGPKFLCLDRNPSVPAGCSTTDTKSTNTIALRIDGLASSAGAGFRVSLVLFNVNDEADPEDVIALTDGVTAGDGVTRTGASTGAPGYGGHREALLLDWTPIPGTAWAARTFVINTSFLAQHGLVMSADMRLVIRQRDNFPTTNNNDGLCIDDVRIDTVPAGGGQAPQPGLAVMDLNAALDVNGLDVPSGAPGPYATHIAAGATLSFSFSGVPGQPLILMAGPLGVNARAYAGIGQLDIGVPNPPGLPTGIIVLFDGTAAGAFGPFLVLSAVGSMGFSLSSHGLPSGFQTTFQAAVLTGGTSIVALSNAVTLHVN
jgi:hypothetical protein